MFRILDIPSSIVIVTALADDASNSSTGIPKM